jgi:aryl-alcohol dehydrogenase-like predicted oxidoreductase
MGADLPRIGLGTNTFGGKVDLPTAKRIIAAALDRGVTLVDTAEVYQDGESERMIGAALRGNRHAAFIATKFSKDSDPRTACEGSLRRLQTDYIDLYQMHRPAQTTPVAETLEVLSRLLEEGKVRAVGHSNFAAWQIANADWISRNGFVARFMTAQHRYSLIEREVEQEVIPACIHFGLGLIAYEPLGMGLLSGKYRRGEAPLANWRLSNNPRACHLLSPDMFDKVESLQTFAAARGVSLLSVAIGGLAAMPGVATVITGVTGEDQVRRNAQAAEWTPANSDLDEIRRLTVA